MRLHESVRRQQEAWWSGWSEEQDENMEETQPLIELTSILAGPTHEAIAAPSNLLAASDELIATYQIAIQPHRDALDTRTIWVSLMQYTDKFAKYIGQLIHLKKPEFRAFQRTGKYQHIVSLNHIIETMIISMIRCYRPSELVELDLFLSHAGEQKEQTVKPLRDTLSEDFTCFFDAESLIVGDSISTEILDALLSCNVGMVLISQDFVKKRWPLLELFILSARASYCAEDDFKLVVATSCSTTEDNSNGWESWFDCVHRLPLPWPGDDMPVAMKLSHSGSGNDSGVRRLSKALTACAEELQVKRKLKKARQRFMCFVPFVLLSLVLLLFPNPFSPFRDKHVSVNPGRPINLSVGPFKLPEIVPWFQGREKEMDQLTEMLNERNSATVVPYGPGGIGKTQLVVTWANKNTDRYGAIVWLRAEQEDTLIEDLSAFAYKAGLASAIAEEDNMMKIAKRAIMAIGAHGRDELPILLVYDNAESYEAVAKWLPTVGSACHTIITTRDNSGLEEDSLLWLGPLDRDSSIRVVEHFVKDSLTEDEQSEILDVFKTFDFLPLAVVQFSSQANELGVPRAIRLYSQQREEAFKEPLRLGRTFTDRDRHRLSVFTVLRMQVESLSHESLVALENLSVVAAERVPLFVLESQIPSEDDVNSALTELQRKAIIQYDSKHQLISTHRLLQDAARDAMSVEKRTAVLNGVGAQLVKTMRGADIYAGRNETFTSLMPHALAIVGRNWTDESPSLGELYFDLARAKYILAGNFKEALEVYIKALPIQRTTWGDTDPHVAATLGEMGLMYENQGLYDEALVLYKQALSIYQESRGEHNPSVATLTDSIASVYLHQGLYDEALELFEQALSMRMTIFGKDDPEVAKTLGNMAVLYFKQGSYEKAVELLNQALSIQKKSLGEYHPDLALTLNNIALMYSRQGRYDKALQMYQQALSINEISLGTDHPRVITTLNNMADAYKEQGFDDKALEMYEQVLSTQKVSLGYDFSDVVSTLNKMALLYDKQLLYNKTLETYEEILSIQKETLGDSHQQVATTLNKMGGVLNKQGLHDQALVSYQEALSIEEASEGANQTNFYTLGGMALAYYQEGLYDEAFEKFEEALVVEKELLGDDHKVVVAYSRLIEMLRKNSKDGG